jgi:hypothetical protein
MLYDHTFSGSRFDCDEASFSPRRFIGAIFVVVNSQKSTIAVETTEGTSCVFETNSLCESWYSLQ